MKAMLHEVTGKNRYCGPTAIATILGISTDHAAALVRKRDGLRAVKGLPTYMLAGVLSDAGCTVRLHRVPDAPTMAAWLGHMRFAKDRHYVVVFRNHFGVIFNRDYLCAQTSRQRVRFADIPGRRGRVVAYLAVDGLPERPPADPTAPRQAEQVGVRKAREEAKRLAAMHNIEIEPLDRGQWNVWPPEGFEDKHIDPYDGDHYADDWLGVLEMVKAYADILITEEIAALRATR